MSFEKTIKAIQDMQREAATGLPAILKRNQPFIKEVVVSMQQRAIDQQRESPSGARWKRLDPKTVRRRRQRGRGAKILVDTGALFRSATMSVKGNRIVMGNTRTYAAFHQFGTRNVPQRSILWAEDSVRRILKSIYDTMVDPLRGSPAL
jgi:phage virion morphogenesis protein